MVCRPWDYERKPELLPGPTRSKFIQPGQPRGAGRNQGEQHLEQEYKDDIKTIIKCICICML